jgi:hypothetical protein
MGIKELPTDKRLAEGGLERAEKEEEEGAPLRSSYAQAV